jgi:hypothetical protein
MDLTDEQFIEAGNLSNEIIDFAFEENDQMSALACLMAAVPYLLDAKIGKGEACRLLKILINGYGDEHGTEKP